MAGQPVLVKSQVEGIASLKMTPYGCAERRSRRAQGEVVNESSSQARTARAGCSRYVESCRHQRRVILDEFVAATRYERKYAVRLLNAPARPQTPIRRQRPPKYGLAVQQALMVVWKAANGICSKRLVPFLPELVAALERHGHLTLEDHVRAQLLSVSAATADRMVRRLREADRPRGISTTKPGRLLKRQVPVRTWNEWNDQRPGFFEADLVAHCGGYTDGAFLYTLCLTDVATGWTECLPLLHRIPSEVVQAVRLVRKLLPRL
jgi:hypothetical protein